MIYTSYFGNLKRIQKYAPNIVPISICSKSPDWYKGLRYKKLAPKYQFFVEWRNIHDNNLYIKNYNKKVLSILNARDVIEELYSMSNNENIVLLCYEKPKYFCHRHLVSEWFNDNGIPCDEINLI